MDKMLLGLLIGAAFGAILQLGGASNYKKILGSLLLKDLTIIKLILTAIAVGTIGIYLLDFFGMANMDIKPTYTSGIIVAGLIFGVGFALAGYCPGTCIVGASEGKTDAVFVILGGLLGAGIYAVVFPLMNSVFNISANASNEITLASVFNVENGIWVAIPFSLILVFLSFKLLKDRYGEMPS